LAQGNYRRVISRRHLFFDNNTNLRIFFSLAFKLKFDAEKNILWLLFAYAWGLHYHRFVAHRLVSFFFGINFFFCIVIRSLLWSKIGVGFSSWIGFFLFGIFIDLASFYKCNFDDLCMYMLGIFFCNNLCKHEK